MKILTQLSVPIQLNETLVLRKVDTRDFKEIYRILSDPKVTKYLSIELPENEEDIKKNIKFSIMDWNAAVGLSYSVFLNGTFIGLVNLYNIRWYYSRAEVGLFLDSRYWEKGYGSKILRKIIEYCFYTLGLHRLEAHIFPQNEASIRLFEKFGFKREGICRDYAQNLDDQWQDCIQYSLLSEEYSYFG
mgnify:CR=1 FL=1